MVLTAGGTHTRLGRQFDPFDEFFNGYLNDLWVFSVMLTADEAASLASGGCTDDTWTPTALTNAPYARELTRQSGPAAK